MNDDDDFDYFQSLQGPAQYGSHQASQRLREPIRRPQAQTFAATPPGMRTRQATTRNRIDREEYWADEQPVLEDLSHVSVHAKVPVIPPITEAIPPSFLLPIPLTVWDMIPFAYRLSGSLN